MAGEGVEYQIWQVLDLEDKPLDLFWWELVDTKLGRALVRSLPAEELTSRGACEDDIAVVKRNCDAPVSKGNFSHRNR